MVYAQVHILLGKELKTGTFRQCHAEQGMGIFNAALLFATHGVAVIDVCCCDCSGLWFWCIRCRHKEPYRDGRRVPLQSQARSGYRQGRKCTSHRRG